MKLVGTLLSFHLLDISALLPRLLHFLVVIVYGYYWGLATEAGPKNGHLTRFAEAESFGFVATLRRRCFPMHLFHLYSNISLSAIDSQRKKMIAASEKGTVFK